MPSLFPKLLKVRAGNLLAILCFLSIFIYVTFMMDGPNDSVQEAYGQQQLPYRCENINDIKLIRKLGEGLSKEVFEGMHYDGYHGNRVAVKMVTDEVQVVARCLNHLGEDEDSLRCFTFPAMRLMKEILILQQLKHQNIARLLGYCLHSDQFMTTMDTNVDLKQHGLVAIHEYGTPISISDILNWSPNQQLHVITELLDLLIYLDDSPMGSVLVPEIAEKHILLSLDGHVKLIDFEDVTSEEPVCSKREPCRHRVPCVKGTCKGFNAKENLDNMHELILRQLLLNSDIPDLVGSIDTIEHYNINASQLKDLVMKNM
ncbi:unnamed protein product [Owenia fusiformis]|uniref:Protein kinase domain-containing protein n=1 Tax=Owenia fusiformis TaxID=6347 RepID=A0A8S4NHM7_OWEFU|nr:unnamed protein product [Owenia fusiformis]